MKVRVVAIIVGALVTGASLASCSGGGISGLKLHTGPPVGESTPTSAASQSSDVACVPSGSMKTYPLGTEAEMSKGLAAYPSGAAAFQAALQPLDTYLQDAWPTGAESGLGSASQIAQWLSVLDPTSPLFSTLEQGPASVAAWSGGVPNPAQAAGVAFDARFLFWAGNVPGSPVGPTWGSANLVGTTTSDGENPAAGSSISYGPGGQVTGLCAGWWVEVGRQAGSSFTWWYIHGVASFQQMTSSSGWLMVNPAVFGFVYDQPGTPSSPPNWIPSCTGTITPACAAAIAAGPAGEPSGATAISLS